MTDLSPAAQAVLDAVVLDAWGLRSQDVPRLTSEAKQHAAAALRALAVRINGADAIRQDVLDIADELQNQ